MKILKIRKFFKAFTLIELLVVISIIAILAGIALPVFSQVQIKGAQTKALSNGKQIALACKVYATDNNGLFPVLTGSNSGVSGTSNDALGNLFPQYLTNETIFWQAKAWECSTSPPNNSDANSASTALARGENHWAYVQNLSDTSNSTYPLLADAFNTITSAACTYSTNPNTLGGIWSGTKAVVILVDCSGSVQKVSANGEVMTGPSGIDLFSTNSTGWLTNSVNVPINPSHS